MLFLTSLDTGQNFKKEKDNDNMTFIYTNINWIKGDMVALIYTISSASVILLLSSFPLIKPCTNSFTLISPHPRAQHVAKEL